MTNYLQHFVRLGVFIGLLAGAISTQAQNGAVRDTAAFFSEASKAEAGRRVAEIGKRFKKDLVIETYAEVPEAVRQGVNLQDKPAANRMFEEWTIKQAKQLRVNGIYILLSKEPAHLQIVVGNDTQHAAFTLKDRDALASLMLARLRAKQNDEALLEGVSFVFNTMASHAATRSQPAVGSTSSGVSRSEGSSGLGLILAVLLGVAVLWLVVGLFRSLAGGGGGAGGGMAAGSSGGGFFSSLLGGMFGAAAGMWLYDQFSGHHGSAWGADQDQGLSSDDTGFRGRDSDYSSSGSDFSDSGGGDSGGDSGGGDSGGGDF